MTLFDSACCVQIAFECAGQDHNVGGSENQFTLISDDCLRNSVPTLQKTSFHRVESFGFILVAKLLNFKFLLLSSFEIRSQSMSSLNTEEINSKNLCNSVM